MHLRGHLLWAKVRQKVVTAECAQPDENRADFLTLATGQEGVVESSGIRRILFSIDFSSSLNVEHFDIMFWSSSKSRELFGLYGVFCVFCKM